MENGKESDTGKPQGKEQVHDTSIRRERNLFNDLLPHHLYGLQPGANSIRSRFGTRPVQWRP